MSLCIVSFRTFSWTITAEEDEISCLVSSTSSKFILSKYEFLIYFRFICETNWIISIELQESRNILSCIKKYEAFCEEEVSFDEDLSCPSYNFALKCITFLENTSIFGSCPICLDPIKACNLKITTCGHSFDVKCWNVLVKNDPRCPLCRAEIM